jgi:hypothetical protein
MSTVRSLVAEVEQARQRVLTAVADLSTEQGAFKPAPSEWSISECLEHLFLAEHGGVSGLWKAIEGVRAQRPVWSGEPVHHGLSSEEIVRRTWGPNQQAPDNAAPRTGGPVVYWAACLESCRPVLARLAHELETPDLESVVYPHVVSGPLDARQRLEFLRFHLDLHRGQIEGVKRAMGAGRGRE